MIEGVTAEQIAQALPPQPPPVSPPPVEQPQVTPRDPAVAERLAAVDQKNASIETYRAAMQVQTTFMNPQVWTQIRAMGKVFYESKALPVNIKNEPQLIMVLQAGFEMGMTPVESLHSLYIVNGSINVYGKAVTRRLREHGWRVRYTDENDDSCTATVTRGREEYTETYAYQMAEKSGYTKSNSGDYKVGWLPGINRKLKLRYGALSVIIKSYIPDVLGAANDIKEVIEDVTLPKEEEKKEDHRPSGPALKPEKNDTVSTETLAERLAKGRDMAPKETNAKKGQIIDKKEETKETVV